MSNKLKITSKYYTLNLDNSMLKQPQRLFLHKRDKEDTKNEQKRLSFTSLSKRRNQPHMKSHLTTRFGPVSPKIYPSQRAAKQNKPINVFKDQGSTDQYRLFSKISKNNVENEKLLISKPTLQSPVNKAKSKQLLVPEYYGTSSQLQKTVRPESRHKIQKYFSEAPSLIRPKSSSSDSNIIFRTEREDMSIKKQENKKTKNYHTFPPNEYYNTWTAENEMGMQYDQVNTSRTSIKFDMSPCFN